MCVDGLYFKHFRYGLYVFAGVIVTMMLVVLLVQFEHDRNVTNLCKDKLSCPPSWHCCSMGCCAPVTASPRTDSEKEHTYDPWYTQWPVLFFLGLLGGIVICCVWCFICRQHSARVCSMSCSCCSPTRRGTEADSAGSLYPPPRYSRCGSFHQAPPPYSEVQSKPDLYPLVITCAEGDGKAGGNYLMVHYFRNYVIRPPAGSLSATSTAESLNSSFICNAANEANSIIPPPYSCATSFEEYGLGCRRSMLRSMSSLTERPPPRICALPAPPSPARMTEAAYRENLQWTPDMDMDQPFDLTQALALRRELMEREIYCDGSWRMPVLGTPSSHHSPTTTEDIVFEPEAYGVRHAIHPSATPETCESPNATSPTQTSKDSIRRPNEERRQRRLDSIKRNIRKSSLYMPLSTAHPVRPSRISPGARASSRSAPVTPCSNLVPNLLNFTHRASRQSSRSSRLEEEYDALLMDTEQSRMDHKF